MSLYTYQNDHARDDYLHLLLSNRHSSTDLNYASLQAKRTTFLRKHVPFRTHAGVDYFDVNALLSIHLSRQTPNSDENSSPSTAIPLQYLIEQAANIQQIHRLQRNWEFGQCIDGGGCSDEIQLYAFTTLDDFDHDGLPFMEGFPASESRIAQIIMSEFERFDCIPLPPDDSTKDNLLVDDESNDPLTGPGRMYDFFRVDDDSYNTWFVQRGNFTYELQCTMQQNQYPCYSVVALIQLFAEIPSAVDATHVYARLLTGKNLFCRPFQHVFNNEKAERYHQIQLTTFFSDFIPLMTLYPFARSLHHASTTMVTSMAAWQESTAAIPPFKDRILSVKTIMNHELVPLPPPATPLVLSAPPPTTVITRPNNESGVNRVDSVEEEEDVVEEIPARSPVMTTTATTIHVPVVSTQPLQSMGQQLERDMRKYEIDVRNDGDTKRRLLELASQERIRTMELEMQLAIERERHQSSLDNLKETNKARIEEAKTGREVARAEQEKQKTLRKDAVEASNVRRWELEADLRRKALTDSTETETKKAAKTTTSFKRVLGPRTAMTATTSTTTLKRPVSSQMMDVHVPHPSTRRKTTANASATTTTFQKPRYTDQYLRPRRGSNKEN